MTITYIIMGLCAYMSWTALNNSEQFHRWDLSPYLIAARNEKYRLFTHAFIHAGWMHFFVNMFVLWQFGGAVEQTFIKLFGTLGYVYYLALYVGGFLFSTIPALSKHKDNPLYRAVGASGAVSSVLFAYILLYPVNLLYLFLVLPIPAFLVGILYLIYENRMKDSNDNIAHDAHYYGAIYGFLVTLIFKPKLAELFVLQVWEQITSLFA